MDVREKLVELLREVQYQGNAVHGYKDKYIQNGELADHLISHGVTVQECTRPLEEWHEDYGDVLWWKFPIEEPPYVGSPLDEKWPAYHTHWTPIVLPEPPKEDCK